MNWFVLIALTVAVGAGLFFRGGVHPVEWNWSLLLIGIAGVAAQFAGRRGERSGVEAGPRWLVLAFTLWCAFQLAPLPAPLVAWLSPTRFEIASALGAPTSLPLTIAPARTFEALLNLLGAVTAFLLAGELMGSFRRKRWIVAAPIIVLGVLEAGLGLVQPVLRGVDNQWIPSSGSFVNRNHFAGFLELALPLAVAAAFGVWSRRRSRHEGDTGRAVGTVVLALAATAMLAAILASQSRMGFIGVLGGLAAMAVVAVLAHESGPERSIPGWRTLAVTALVVLATIGVFRWLPSEDFQARFKIQVLSEETRPEYWRESGSLISAYRLTGCGLGTFESGFWRYKTIDPDHIVDYAHNDYLQTLAELGVVGFAIGMALTVLIVRRAFGAALRHRDSSHWPLLVGLCGSITCLLLHSLTDFNLYIPTNATVLAWICGMACAQRTHSARESSQHRSEEEEPAH